MDGPLDTWPNFQPLKMKLNNRVAFITGASGVLGEEIAVLFAQEGASLALAARSVDKLEAIARKVRGLGCRATVCRCDIMNNQDISSAIHRAVENLGTIDILVNSAGIISYEAVHELSDEVWHRTMQINATAPFVAIREVLPSMIERRWGRIINMGSISSKMGFAYRSGYAASKHALLGLTRSLSAEVASLGITANCICPTFIPGPMLDESIQKWADKRGVSFEQQAEELRNRVPIKRYIKPSEVSALALYLASDDSAAVTGQAINVDGGILQY